MNWRKASTGLIAAAMVVLMSAGRAQADTLYFFFNSDDYTGAYTPLGTPPYLAAKIIDAGANKVHLTMHTFNPLAAPGTTGLVGSEFVSNWFFNSTVAITKFDHLSGVEAQSAAYVDDGFSSGGGYDFDVRFTFDNDASGDRLTVGDSSTYELEGVGLTIAAFLEVSETNSPSKPSFYTVAHVQGIGATGAQSGWIPGDSELVPVVPLPAAAWAGLVLLGGIGAKRITRRTPQA